MKTFTAEEKNYIFGFIDKSSKKPENLTIEYETEGWYGGRHIVHATVLNSFGEVKISFASSDYWGYVNNLGLCYVNGKETKTADLIGEYKYTKNESTLLTTLTQLINV